MDMVAMIGDATSRADILSRLGWDPAEDADTAGILRSVYMLTDGYKAFNWTDCD